MHPAMPAPKHILVKMPNWLGDLVMATPVLKDLHSHWPNARITAMCQSGIAQLLAHDPNINQVYSYKRPSGWIRRLQHGEIIDTIRFGEYDLGVILTNSFSSAWWFWRGHVKNRLGYATNLRSLLLTTAQPFPANLKTQHLVNTYKDLLLPLGIPQTDSSPQLYITSQEMAAAREQLRAFGVEKKNFLLGVNPGAAYGSAKCWLPERFVSTCKHMLERPDLSIVFFGDQSGAPLVNQICSQLPNDRVINLAGKTNLRELMAFINCCSLFLTNDSGPMHVAAALKVPLLALFGSTNDIRTGPYHIGKVIHKHVECSPCYKRICPIDFRCMKRIEVDEVVRELQGLMAEIN